MHDFRLQLEQVVRVEVVVFGSCQLVASESAALAGHMSQILMVVAAKQTTEVALKEALKRLEDCNCPVGLLLNKGEASYSSSTRIKGYPLKEGKKMGRVLVETDGKVSPEDVGVVYANTLEELKAFEPAVGGTRDVLDEIVAIPAAALCEPSAYPGTDPPDDCGTVPATIAFGKGASKKLLLAHDRVPLGDAMRTGVARAVCEFQVSYADPEKQADLIDKVCEMT